MSTVANKYCLDANVLIQAWQKYYNPKFCPDYWEILIELGKQEKIFIPEYVSEEIVRTEDDLAMWLKGSNIPMKKVSEQVANCLKIIYSSNPIHQNLVDNTKARSLADPWVIAHALHENAVVVTKEEKVTALNSVKIKIPNVCDNMGIRWLNDFQFIDEINIKFNCFITN
jgi:rRNA-processing protein FCF1